MQAKASDESASGPERPCGLCGKPLKDKETEDYISSVCSKCGPQDYHLACVQDYLIGKSQEFTNSIRRQKVKEKSLRRPQEEFASWKCPDGIYLGQWVGRGTGKHWEGPICPGSIQSAEWIKPRKEKKTHAPTPAPAKSKAGAAAGGKKAGTAGEAMARTDLGPPGLARPRSHGGGGGAASSGTLSAKQGGTGAGAWAGVGAGTGGLQKNKSWGPGSGGLWFEKGTRPKHLRMCIHWSEYGECRLYGCEFCHGEEELARREQEWREEQVQMKREKELEEQERKRVALEDHIYNTQAFIPLSEETFELMKEYKTSHCMASLIEMGFTTRQAKLASRATGAAVPAAVQLLTSGESIATLSNKPSKPVDVSRESEQLLEKASLLGFTAAAVDGQIKSCNGDWNAAEEVFEEMARVQAVRRAEQEAEEAAALAAARAAASQVQQAQQEAGQAAAPAAEEGWHFGGGEGQLPSWPEEAAQQYSPPGEQYSSTAFLGSSTTQGPGGFGSQQGGKAVAQLQQQQPGPAASPTPTSGSMHTAQELLRALLPATPPPLAQARGASISPPHELIPQGGGSQSHSWTGIQPPLPDPNIYRQPGVNSAPFGPPPPLAPAPSRAQAPQQQGGSLAPPQLHPAGHPPSQPAAAPGPTPSLFNSLPGQPPPGQMAGAPAAAGPLAYDAQGTWPLGGFSSGGISPSHFSATAQQQQAQQAQSYGGQHAQQQQQQAQQPQHYASPHAVGHATGQQQQPQQAQHYGGHPAQQPQQHHYATPHAMGHATWGQQHQQQAQLAQQNGVPPVALGPAPSFSFPSQGLTASGPPASLGLPGPGPAQSYGAGGGAAAGQPNGSFDSGFQAGLAAAMAHLGILNTGAPGVGAAATLAQHQLAWHGPPLARYEGTAAAAPAASAGTAWPGQAPAPASAAFPPAHTSQTSASLLGQYSTQGGAGSQAGLHQEYPGTAHGAGGWAPAGMGDARHHAGHAGLAQQPAQQAQQTDFEDMLQLLCST